MHYATKGDFEEYIPCLFLPIKHGARLMIYFHANAEDIGSTYEMINYIGHKLSMHVLSVEYPGYGLYKTTMPCEAKMKEDADTIYDYLT
jgi:hypothetical protein